MGLGTIAGAVASLIVGGAVAAVTLVGLVSSSTGADGASPADVQEPIVQYGETGS